MMPSSSLAKKTKMQPEYLVAGVICLLFVMTRFFFADFYENEWAYTAGPIKMLHPSFLTGDPFISGITSTFLLYNVLAAPFYFLFNYLPATLICRILIWCFQIWALLKLAKTLGLTWWGCVLLFVIWLDVEQTLVAGEWIIKCATAKPVSYGFVFLSLDNLLRGRLKRSGIFSGLAISFHVLVGLWSTAAIVSTIVLTRKGGREVLSFCMAAFLWALPGLAPALYNAFFNASTMGSSAADVARVSVLMANPFHLDPNYFITAWEYLKVAVVFLLTIVFLKNLVVKEKALPLIVFISCLFVFFVSGIAARYGEWYLFLQYYPFRVFDAFLPLSFWMGFVLLFQEIFYRFPRRGVLLFLAVPLLIGGVNYLIDRCDSEPRYGFSLRSFTTCMLRTEPRLTAYNVKERYGQWNAFIRSDSLDDLKQIEVWIKEHTPMNSLFITPPWDWHFYSFTLKAERPEFVSFKYVPANGNILRWKGRMEILNRGQFHEMGFGILKELREHYPDLKEDELVRIKEKYGPDYILTSSTTRFNLPLIHENNSYRLYRL